MARKPLTRFVVEIDGELKRLFSVCETSKGQLIIDTASANVGQFDPAQFKMKPLLQTKYTVHPSTRSADGENNIHRTQTFIDQTRLESSLQTSAPRDGRFQVIYSRSVPDPKLTPSLVPSARDKIVSLGTYDPGNATLLYGVWVSSAESAERFEPHLFYSSVVEVFRTFCLAVPFAFADRPSSPTNVTINVSTSRDERLSESERKMGYTAGPIDGSAPSELWLPTTRHFNELANSPPDTMHLATPQKQDWVTAPDGRRARLVGLPVFTPIPKEALH